MNQILILFFTVLECFSLSVTIFCVPSSKWSEIWTTWQQPSKLWVVTHSTYNNSTWSKDWSQDSQLLHGCLPNRFQNLTQLIANSAVTVFAITHFFAWLLVATGNQVMAITSAETLSAKKPFRPLPCIVSLQGHENSPSSFLLQFCVLFLQKGPWNMKALGCIIAGSPYNK